MRLEIRLTLACLAIIALFVMSFAATWWILGGRELLRPPGGSWPLRIRDLTHQAYLDGGWPAVHTALRWAYLPPDITVNLYQPRGEHRVFQGKSRPFEAAAADRALKQGGYEIMTVSGPELWVPVGDPSLSGYLRLDVDVRNQDHGRYLLFLLVISAVVASTLAFLAGLWGSRAVARPIQSLVQATQAMAQSDFHHRIPTEGPGELSQLAQSFNFMADNLEKNIESLIAARDRADQAKDKAERSEASRRQFLADVSHNLRTPLAAILGWSEALLDGLTPGEEMIHLRNIRQETLYVSQNVQRLLDWSRWEESPPQLVYEEFAVSEPLMECVQTLEEVAQNRSITLKLLGLEGEPRVRADRHKVRELFQLLLENAVQHNPPGTEIEVSFSAQASERLEVVVSDNGKGLPEELSRQLECRAGGGLGLAIASRLAQAHGGELQYQPGEPGTRLSFSLSRC